MQPDQGKDEFNAASGFLRLISNNPDGDGLMQAFCLGPMSIYGATSAALHTVDGGRENLLIAGQHGFTPRIARFESVPLSWDFPATRAFNGGDVVITATDEVDQSYPLLSPSRALLTEDPSDASFAGSTIMSLPIVYQGTTTAVCSVVCRHDRPWTWADFAFIDGLCAAISMWNRIRVLSDLQLTSNRSSAHQRIPQGGLTERQQAILALIRDGRSNASIAKTLGYSISTVKNEVQTLIALMGVSNRRQVVERAEQAGLTERPSRGSTAEAPDA